MFSSHAVSSLRSSVSTLGPFALWQEGKTLASRHDRTGRLRTIVRMYECCGPQCVTSRSLIPYFLPHPSPIARHTRPLSLHRTNAPRVPEYPSTFLLPTARATPPQAAIPRTARACVLAPPINIVSHCPRNGGLEARRKRVTCPS